MRQMTATCVSAFIAALVAAPSQASAQRSVPGAPVGATVPAIEQRIAVDSFLAMLPDRGEAEIDSLIDRAAKRVRAAARRRLDTDRVRRRTREAHETQQLEIDRATRLIRVAEEIGRSDRKSGLEHERSLRERYRDLIAIRIEALEHEMVVAEADERYAEATGRRLAVERELAAGRSEWSALSHGRVDPGGEEVSATRNLDLLIHEGLERFFGAMREEERELENLARARQALVEVQLRVLAGRRDLFDD